jgi:tetratricopeptide (TPR) repeat protein
VFGSFQHRPTPVIWSSVGAFGHLPIRPRIKPSPPFTPQFGDGNYSLLLESGGDMRLPTLLVAASLFSVVWAPRAVASDVDICATETGDAAIAACAHAISSGSLHDRDLAVEYYNRGVKYASKGDYDLAVADYNEAIRLDPNYAEAYGNLGNAYRAKRDFDHALANYNAALDIRPGALDYFNRGNTLYDMNVDFDRVIADYTEAIELDPTFALAYYNRGLAKRAKGDSIGGMADIARAMQLNPKVGQ